MDESPEETALRYLRITRAFFATVRQASLVLNESAGIPFDEDAFDAHFLEICRGEPPHGVGCPCPLCVEPSTLN